MSVESKATRGASRGGEALSEGRGANRASGRLPPRVRLVLSLLIGLHVLAVVAEPLRFFTRSSRGTAPLAELPRRWLAPYIDFAYLSHGYFFFAPEPGPSHLIDFHLVAPDGKRLVVRYPDRHAQWPRLLYHRHFMLAENLNQLWVPPWEGADPSVAPDVLEAWKRDRARFERVRDSMARHVARRFGGKVVAVDRVEHILPSDIQVFDEHIQLHDPRLYVVLPDAVPADDSGEVGPAVAGGLVHPPRLPWSPKPDGEEVPLSTPIGQTSSPPGDSAGRGVMGGEGTRTDRGGASDE